MTSLYPSHQHPAAGTFVREQVRALAQTHRVTVVCHQEMTWRELLRMLIERQPDTEHEEQWTVYRLRYARLAGKVLPLYLLTMLLWSARIEWRTVDIIHTHVALPAGFAAVLLNCIVRKPLVITEHAGDFPNWIRPFFRRLLFHWTIQQSRCVMPVSHTLQRQIEQAHIVTRFAVVPNIVNTALFHRPSTADTDSMPAPPERSRPLHLLWVGGVRHDYYLRKGGPLLLQAVALAHPRLAHGLHLTLIVDGPARAACEETIARLKIGAICTVAGMMSNSEVRDRMQQCDALVLASRSESFGMVLIEAMSCGKPVIATRCGGPEEIVTAETGILVAVDDPHALADGIVRMAQTLHTFDPQRIAAYAAHHFGPQAVVQQLEQVYTEAITVSVQQNLNP